MAKNEAGQTPSIFLEMALDRENELSAALGILQAGQNR